MTSLQKTIRVTIGWCFSLGTKFVEVTPFTTLTVQLANFAAQILLIITFFLPIKVLVLLGSDSIPNYFPLYLKNLNKTHLIIAFSFLALICYIFYMVSEFVVSEYSKKGAAALLKKSAKLNLFENQQRLATQAYSKFTRGLSSGMFSVVAFLIVLYIYPFFFAVIVSYIALSFVLIVVFYNRRQRARYLLGAHHGVILNALSSVGFLVAFFCMVTDFLYLAPPKIFTALISLLLMRQGLSRLAVMIQDVIALRSQYRQINALFFHGQQLVVEAGVHSAKIKDLLNERQRKKWMSDVMRAINPAYVAVVSSSWHQLGRADIYAFEAKFEKNESSETKTFLFKLFGKSSFSLAEQERVLLQAMPDIPAPRFFGLVKVDDLICHVFEFCEYKKLTHRQIGPGVIDIAQKLISIEPTDVLVKQFSRSYLFLEQRLSSEIISNLSIVATQSQSATLERFGAKYADIIEVLSRLPRQIISQDTTSDTLLISEAGNVCVSHWASWRMEPVGSNWPVGERLKLQEAVNAAKVIRKSLFDIAPAAIVLCALTYAFERLCYRANYVDAMSLLPDILEQLESIETSTDQYIESASCRLLQ